MKLSAALYGGLVDGLKAEIKKGESAAFSGMDTATQGLKNELRSQITGAGLGKRLAQTWRSKTYPEDRKSLKPAGFIWSKAPEIVSVHAEGATIRAKRGAFLAIPLPAAGKRGGREKVTPSNWQRSRGQRLRFVPRRGGGGLLVAENARLTKSGVAAARTGKGAARLSVPLFLLVPQVVIKGKLNIDKAANKWRGKVPDLIAAAWK